MKKRMTVGLSIILALVLLWGSSVFAFQDVTDVEGKEKINDLKNRNIIQGIDTNQFAPHLELSYAQGLSLIVRALGLEGSSEQVYFDHILPEAWYAEAFRVAAQNGIEIPTSVEPHGSMSREAFGDVLYQALMTTGEYAFTEMWFMINDEDEVDESYMNHIQRLLNAGIVKLDEQQNFYPKQSITRAEAAVWVYNLLEMVAANEPVDPGPPGVELPPVLTEEVSYEETAINEEITEIVLSWGEQPNPGYRLSIKRIEFDGEEAQIYYQKHYPDPEMMYPQVISYPTATTYVPSGFKITIHEHN